MKGGYHIIRNIRKWLTMHGGSPPENSGSASRTNPGNRKQFLLSHQFLIYVLFGIVGFLLVLFSGLGQGPGSTVKEVSNVHYIDSVGSNLLFRGGLPQEGHPSTMNYQGLKKAIMNAGKKAGIKVPASYYLLDVNLLNVENQSDAQWIKVEQQFFEDHPQLGKVQVWGMNGVGISATAPELATCREYLARHLDSWLNDRLASRVETLRGWLEEKQPVVQSQKKLPIVIFIHCVAGCDRTGELSAAYYLRYMNKTWEEVNALNQSMCRRNRTFHCRNYRAVQWYCLYLNLKYGTSLQWWKELPCSGK